MKRLWCIIICIITIMSLSSTDKYREPVVMEYEEPIHVAVAEPEIIEEELEIIQYTAFNDGHQPEELEIDMICKMVSCEVGDRYIGTCIAPEWVIRYVVSVVINRVNHPLFEDTIHDVIYEPGQYQPAIDGTLLDAKYDDTVRENVEYCLLNGSVIPDNVCYQSTNKHNGSGIYAQWTSNVTGATIYFNYV